jgi:hypothetical protein
MMNNDHLEDYVLAKLAVVTVAGRLELHGWYDGIECLLDAKPSLLAAGVVACIPLDPVLALDWPMQAITTIGGDRVLLDSVTADPRTIAAFKRFQAAVIGGTAKAGMRIDLA